ncbi:hypothetical protein MAR_037804 [Mya arenaria]|uniref:EGF-like domain-containing protein n=1 Tax=Mya arenaria TaxID=6604 RepID=A0ABY7FQ26_MYAAR|nr:hypothetical protein MAR_037804 [Mya arenaria]
MVDMDFRSQSFAKANCGDSGVIVNQMDQRYVQIKETGSTSENGRWLWSWIAQHSRCLIFVVILTVLGFVAFANVSHKKGIEKQNGRDAVQIIQQPLAQHQYMVRHILQNTESPENSPIIYVVDHEASGCPEPYCQRCSANVPDPLQRDDNIRGCLLKSSQNASYCENGGSLECFNIREEPRCVCPPGWTGDTCATPRETQVQCKCYANELINNRELIGQRSVSTCLSSDKPSQWNVCHMDRDNYNCICNKTDTESYEDSNTLSSELPSCSSLDNSHSRRHRSTDSTGQISGSDSFASHHTNAADHILSGHLSTLLVLVLAASIRNTG